MSLSFGRIGFVKGSPCGIVSDTKVSYLDALLEMQDLDYVNKSNNADPSYSNDGDSGFDLRAWIDCEEHLSGDSKDEYPYIYLLPLERKLIHTGLYFKLPDFTELQVRPRSGAANKLGLSVVNTPGTVDERYRGEVCIIAINLSNETIKIHNGDRIAQAVLMPVYNSRLVTLNKVDQINTNTERGSKGFGSSGIK